MKKGLATIAIMFTLLSCGPSSTQSGTDNDGMKVGDTNGGLADTTFNNNAAVTDTAKGEDRVDISTRDTIKNQ